MKTEKSTQNLFKMIRKSLLCFFKKPKECVLRYRFRFLGGAAVVGIVLALSWCLIAHFTPTIDPNSRLAANLTMLFLSLPVLCLLWFFRTHDTNEQIQKTQANINTNMLHKAIDFALAKETDNKDQVETETENKNPVGIDRVKRAIGLKMLAQMRRTDPEFKRKIDFVTKGLDLNGVNLANADLREINLKEADLRGANLYGTNLQEADFQGAKLQKADLRGADFLGAVFREAVFQGTNLQKTNLIGAVLQGAYLQETNLRGADLQETNLRGAHLEGAHLQAADLQGANLEEAHLEGAHLQAADLQGANLEGTNLQEADLEGARYNRTTRFPPDFNSLGARIIDTDKIENSPPQ